MCADEPTFIFILLATSSANRITHINTIRTAVVATMARDDTSGLKMHDKFTCSGLGHVCNLSDVRLCVRLCNTGFTVFNSV